jgi:hypothetical protein
LTTAKGKKYLEINKTKNAMKHLPIFLIFCLNISLASAQKANTENRFEGYILYADGTKKEGIIEVEDSSFPWTFQENIKFFDKSLLAAGRVKREQKTNCIPGEVIEYGFSDRKFIHVSYYVKGSDEDNILKSSFGKFKGEKNTDFFAEIYRPGNVSLLKFFIPPTLTDEDYDDAELMKKHAEESKTSYDILITRPGEKPKSIDDISVKGFFKDCPFVVDKYNDGKYKIKPGKSLKAMFKSEKLPGIKMEDAANDILSDYETHCNK